MRVVYTPLHLVHDVVSETIMGQAIPAYEVPERAERIRAALVADGGFELVAPTEHGTDPILAVHDPGLLRFLEEAWPQLRREGIERAAADGRHVCRRRPVRGLRAGVGAVHPGADGDRRAGGLLGRSTRRPRSSRGRTWPRGARWTRR